LKKLEEVSGALIDSDSAKYNLEHILPQSPAENWPHFTHNSVLDMVNRLGNLTIIETSLNRRLGNCDFQAKNRYIT